MNSKMTVGGGGGEVAAAASNNASFWLSTCCSIRSSRRFLLLCSLAWSLSNVFIITNRLNSADATTPSVAVDEPENAIMVHPHLPCYNNETTATTTRTVHVLFGLCGNHSGFVAEFEVALKSVLLNTIDYSLNVHIMADQDAYHAVGDVLERNELSTWKTRNEISIITHNVQPHIPKWKKHLKSFLGSRKIHNTAYKHTIGAWFRLFAHEVLPSHVENVLYMDSDVIVMSSIEALWDTIDDHHGPVLFHVGETKCSGFIILNLGKIDTIWETASKIDLFNFSRATHQRANDQLLFRAIKMNYPELVGVLPQEWDMHVADGIWEYKETIVEHRPKVSMIHFNGGGASIDSYFRTHNFLKDKSVEGTFGLANYYVRLPWPWAKHMAMSNIRSDQQGYPLKIIRSIP